jgi:hypothetical protein
MQKRMGFHNNTYFDISSNVMCCYIFELKIISKIQNFTLQDLYLTFHSSKLTLVFSQPFILGHCFLCLKNISKIIS